MSEIEQLLDELRDAFRDKEREAEEIEQERDEIGEENTRLEEQIFDLEYAISEARAALSQGRAHDALNILDVASAAPKWKTLDECQAAFNAFLAERFPAPIEAPSTAKRKRRKAA